MGCVQSSKIYTENSDDDDTYTKSLKRSSIQIQEAYDEGFCDALFCHKYNSLYNKFLSSQDYYNDGFLAGYSVNNAYKIFQYTANDSMGYYNKHYGINIINNIIGYKKLTTQ